MESTIRVEDFAGCPLAVVRRRASHAELARVVPEACGTVWNLLNAQQITGAGRHVAVYLDTVFNMEIGVELAAPATTTGELLSSSLPAGMVAVTTHFGPYHLLGAAHQAILAWYKANGYESGGPCWETYGHWKEEWNNDPSKIRTDVYYLVSK